MVRDTSDNVAVHFGVGGAGTVQPDSLFFFLPCSVFSRPKAAWSLSRLFPSVGDLHLARLHLLGRWYNAND
jgi:hypothetical protein